ncbi:MAG: hypothetical protein EOS21_24060 [Mesorhizobium sp.]|nr:MAG: hypothetical protein EOS21_24060 [Mesorhizobium sp.]
MMPACERRFPALPVLTYPKVRSAPVLGIHHSRRGLTRISTHLRRLPPGIGRENHYFSRFLIFFRRASGQGESPLIL